VSWGTLCGALFALLCSTTQCKLPVTIGSPNGPCKSDNISNISQYHISDNISKSAVSDWRENKPYGA